ncbi:hypothetical protein LA304_14210 [Celeribacter sp. ASW11-22]|nr:hypothetical protein [Celeribacter litoreus]
MTNCEIEQKELKYLFEGNEEYLSRLKGAHFERYFPDEDEPRKYKVEDVSADCSKLYVRLASRPEGEDRETACVEAEFPESSVFSGADWLLDGDAADIIPELQERKHIEKEARAEEQRLYKEMLQQKTEAEREQWVRDETQIYERQVEEARATLSEFNEDIWEGKLTVAHLERLASALLVADTVEAHIKREFKRSESFLKNMRDLEKSPRDGWPTPDQWKYLYGLAKRRISDMRNGNWPS